MVIQVYGRIGRISHPANDEEPIVVQDPHRLEVPVVGPDEQQYKIILLDAEDSFDVVIEYHSGLREAVWSLAR